MKRLALQMMPIFRMYQFSNWQNPLNCLTREPCAPEEHRRNLGPVEIKRVNYQITEVSEWVVVQPSLDKKCPVVVNRRPCGLPLVRTGTLGDTPSPSLDVYECPKGHPHDFGPQRGRAQIRNGTVSRECYGNGLNSRNKCSRESKKLFDQRHHC